MVDKVWSDWQHQHPDNFWAFEGGSVQIFDNLTVYNTYPNGAPPFLSVRANQSHFEYCRSDIKNKAQFYDAFGRPVPWGKHWWRDEHQRRVFVLWIRVDKFRSSSPVDCRSASYSFRNKKDKFAWNGEIWRKLVTKRRSRRLWAGRWGSGGKRIYEFGTKTAKFELLNARLSKFNNILDVL